MAGTITKADVKAFVEAAHGRVEIVKQMLADQPGLLTLPNGNETAMGAACQMKHQELVHLFLDAGVPLDIYSACVLGLTDKVEEFIAADPEVVNTKNVTSHGKRPLYFASEHPAITALLIAHGAK